MHNRPIRVAAAPADDDVVLGAAVSCELVLASDVVEPPCRLAVGGLMPDGFGSARTFGGCMPEPPPTTTTPAPPLAGAGGCTGVDVSSPLAAGGAGSGAFASVSILEIKHTHTRARFYFLSASSFLLTKLIKNNALKHTHTRTHANLNAENKRRNTNRR